MNVFDRLSDLQNDAEQQVNLKEVLAGATMAELQLMICQLVDDNALDAVQVVEARAAVLGLKSIGENIEEWAETELNQDRDAWFQG